MDQSLWIPLTLAQLEEHDAMVPPIATLAAIAERRPLRPAEHLQLMQLLTKQRMISNGLCLVQFTERWSDLERIEHPEPYLEALDSPKLSAFRDLVAAVVLDQGRKMIVFSQWRRMLRLAHWAVRDLLAEAGLRAGYFTGAESQGLRTEAVTDFHDDPAMRILYLTDAGGVGLNLQRAASCCVNLELPWNPAVLEQRVGRVHRLGQSQPVTVYNFVAAQGIEAKIADIVDNKRQLFEALFDGEADEIPFARSNSLVQQLALGSEPPSREIFDQMKDGVSEEA